MTTPKLGMPELSVSQASKEITHNQAIAILDQTSQLTVVSRSNTPPGSPSNGAAYIVTATATGAWAGKEGQIAYWLSSVGAWQFIATANGWMAWSDSDAKTYRKESGSWVELATGGGGASNATQTVAISSGALNLSATTAEIIVVDLNQSVTSITMPSGVSGQAVNRRIVFTQSGASNFTVAGWTSVAIEGSTAPVAATGVGAVTEYMLSNTNNAGWRMYVDQGITLAQVGQLGGFRNKLINGNFQVNQRVYVSGTATTIANQYTLDRWHVVTSGQNLAFTANGNGNQITAPAGGVEQVIEGINIEGGTYVLNWTGTATATVNGTARAKGESFTLTANTNTTVRFSGGTVSLAQLERGTLLTPFEHRPYGVELDLCRRFTRVIGRGLFGQADSNTSVVFAMSFDPPMRAAPTYAGVPGSGTSAGGGGIVRIGSSAQDFTGFGGSSLTERGGYAAVTGSFTIAERYIALGNFALLSSEL